MSCKRGEPGAARELSVKAGGGNLAAGEWGVVERRGGLRPGHFNRTLRCRHTPRFRGDSRHSCPPDTPTPLTRTSVTGQNNQHNCTCSHTHTHIHTRTAQARLRALKVGYEPAVTISQVRRCGMRCHSRPGFAVLRPEGRRDPRPFNKGTCGLHRRAGAWRDAKASASLLRGCLGCEASRCPNAASSWQTSGERPRSPVPVPAEAR